MGKRPKPYVRCEKRGPDLVLTVMAGGTNGHVLKGRGTCPLGDKVALETLVKQLLNDARA